MTEVKKINNAPLSVSGAFIRSLAMCSFLVIIQSISVYGQVDFTRNQLSINASKFVLIFNEQVNNLDLTYRVVAKDSTHYLRLATSLDLSTNDDAVTDYSIRVGIDRVFKTSGNWKFYSGVDFNYTNTNAKSAQRITTKLGLIPFVGFLYHFGPHFSISTEPSLAIFRNKVEDKNSFNPDVNTTEYAFDFINLGQIKVGFHF